MWKKCRNKLRLDTTETSRKKEAPKIFFLKGMTLNEDIEVMFIYPPKTKCYTASKHSLTKIVWAFCWEGSPRIVLPNW